MRSTCVHGRSVRRLAAGIAACALLASGCSDDDPAVTAPTSAAIDNNATTTTVATAAATTTAAVAGVTTSVTPPSAPIVVDEGGVSSLPPDRVGSAVAPLPVGSLTQAERDGLVFMREEERLAEDVYRALFAKWQLAIFDNIAKAEATHTASVKTLLDRYQLADPTSGRAAGTYQNAQIQALYDALVAKGSTSLVAAVSVGAEIEDLDIADLRARQTSTPDIALVYSNLEKGSRNHLRSFVSQLTSRGATYTPAHISQQDFDAIVGSAIERGASS